MGKGVVGEVKSQLEMLVGAEPEPACSSMYLHTSSQSRVHTIEESCHRNPHDHQGLFYRRKKSQKAT